MTLPPRATRCLDTLPGPTTIGPSCHSSSLPESVRPCCSPVARERRGLNGLLRERDNSGDREQAVALYDESLQIAKEVGMRPLMERVLSRKEILGA